MKIRVILKIIAFVLVLLLLDILSNFIYKRFIMADTPEMKTQIQFEQSDYKIKTLILGDSHLQHGIDTRILKHSFNYSVAAETYILTYYKLKYILDNNLKKFDTVILNIDPHSFTSGRSNRLPFPYNYYYVKFVDYLELGKRKNRMMPYLYEYIKGEFFSFVGSRTDIDNKLKGKGKRFPMIKGFVISKQDFSKMDRQKIAKRRARSHFFKQKSFDRDMIFYFERILNLCEESKIKVLLIKMPLSQEYYSQVQKNMGIDKFYLQIDKVIKKKSIALMDAQKDFLYEPDLFGDCDHLNARGAKILTERVSEFLKRFK